MRKLSIVAPVLALVIAAASAQAQTPAPSALEKNLVGAWSGSWTGGSSGNVEFRFVRSADGKLGGEATPHASDGDPYTAPFVTVVTAGDKVTMALSTPDGAATIRVEAQVTGADMKGTYAVSAPDGTVVDSGTVVAKKKV